MQLRRAAFPILAWGLVLHSFVIAILFGGFGAAMEIVRPIAAWKEIALMLLLVAVTVRAATRQSSPRPLAPSDFIAAALIALAASYLIASSPLFRSRLEMETQLLGFRDAVFFMLLYYVGRGAPDLVREFVARGHLFIIAAITSAIAVLEWFLVTPEMLVALGIASYFQEFLGVAEFTAGNDYGLPMNYWAGVGGIDVQRAGSVFLSGQGLAVPFLLFFPATLVWAFERERRSVRHFLGVGLVGLGLLLSITRATIAVAFIQLVLYVTLRRRPEWAVFGFATGGVAFLLMLVAFPPLATFVWQTLTWQEQSAVGHVVAWTAGLEAVFQQPWGWGLGTADQTAVRAGLVPLTGDNLYLKYAVEMGLLGVGLLVALLATIAAAALRLATLPQRTDDRRLGTVVFLATAGIAINAVTASVFNSVPLAWLYFLSAGAAAGIATARMHASARYASPVPVRP